MNGYKALENSARILGLSSVDENLKIIGLPLVNAVLNDMGFKGLNSLSEKVGLPSEESRITFTFGLAALISNSVGDSEGFDMASKNYKKRMALLKGRVSSVLDVLPKGEY